MAHFEPSRAFIFSKTIETDQDKKKLQIPAPFTQYITDLTEGASGSAILVDRSKKSWIVKLSEERDGLCIDEGWEKFCIENSLSEGDFMILEHPGGKIVSFNIKIFDKYGAEKFDLTHESSFLGFNQESEEIYTGRKENCHKHSSQGLQEGSTANGTEKDAPEESSTATMDFVCVNRVGDSSLETSGNGSEGNATEGNSAAPMDSADGNPSSGAAQSAWSKACAFSSSNSHFKISLTKSSVQKYHMHIPKEACPKMLPNERKVFVLRNSDHNVWTVCVIPTAKGHSFTIGWHKFVRENGLQEGDVCLFEFVQRNELLVHVYR